MKRFAALLFATCLVTGLTAPVFAADTPVVQLKLSVPPDTPDNKAQREALFAKFKRFETANPGVKIVPVDFTYSDRQSFFLKQAAGIAPDTFDVYATEAQMLASKKWAAPLDEYIANWDKKAWYNPASFAPFTVDGKVYGVPSSNYVNHIIYNKKLFKAKGIPEPTMDWTWKEFIDDAVKLTDKSKGIAGYVHMTKGSEGGWALTDFLYASGGEVESVDASGNAHAVFDSPEAIAAAQLLKDLKWKYDVLPANWLNGWTDVFNVFGDGKAAMVFDGGWGRNVAINGEGMDWHDIGVALMPKGLGPKGRQAGVMGGAYWIINGLTKDKAVRDMAWKWQTFEMWDDGAINDLKSQIADARKNKLFLAHFDYKPLLPDAPYYSKEKAVYDANKDVALTWGTPAFLKALPLTAHAEPPVAAQDVYGKYLSPLVQKLMSDKNADPAALMKEANAKFQKEVLDPANAAN